MEFPLLFKPLKLRGVELPNRIMVPPHGNGLATHEFMPSERQAYYFAEKAKGGAGVIVWGASFVHPNSINKSGRNLISKQAVSGYRFASDLVHHNGGKLFTQLSHVGRQVNTRTSRVPSWGASAMPDPVNRETPKVMEPEDFDELLRHYRLASEVAMEGGFDGVEVYAAHGYMLSQLLSPVSNRRTDEYGGSLENRVKFPIQVLRAVRDVIGSSVPMGLRINGDDLIDGGLTPNDLAEIAYILTTEAEVDYVSVSGGTYASIPIWMGEMTVPPGVFVPFAGLIKSQVSVPVVAVNRIADPVQAEDILARGFADIIAINRAMIADPFWAQKARTGRVDEIRRCTYSNQGCLARATAGLPIGCIQNPVAGFEKEWGEGTLTVSNDPKRVMIVGGGPAGLEAARVAALRGHNVTLLERGNALGGQINQIAMVNSRHGFKEITSNFSAELKRLNVVVKFGHEATLDNLREMAADVLVFATGSSNRRDGFSPTVPAREELPGVTQAWVKVPTDVFEEIPPEGAHVLLHDDQSDACALMTAEYLLDHGCRVTMTTRLASVGQGPEFDASTLTPQLQRLFRHRNGGFKLHVLLALTGLTPDHGSNFTHVYSREEVRIDGIDFAVINAGNLSRNELYLQAKAQKLAPQIVGVGDCIQPRRILDAVYDAHRVMREI